jgi:hypothetical protein
MTNVHAMPHRESGEAKSFDQISPLMELCVHGGGSRYFRDVVVLDPNSIMAKKLKMVLSECVECENSLCSYDPLIEQKNRDDSEDGDAYLSAESNEPNSTSGAKRGDLPATVVATGCKRTMSKALASSDESTDVIAEKVPRCGSATAVSRINGDDERCTLKTVTGTFKVILCYAFAMPFGHSGVNASSLSGLGVFLKKSLLTN